MHTCIEKGDIVIVGNREDSQLGALECGANCVIITMGKEPTDTVVQAAIDRKAIIMVTQTDTFTTARLVNQSVPIGYVMCHNDLVKFNIEEFVDDIRDKMLKTRYRSYPVVDENNRIKGSISRYHLISTKKKKIILLDHNEKTQTVNGIEQAEVLEIIDHHRLGDIQTNNPIYVKNEPVGSTATIIANMYFEAGIRPAKGVAGIMCAAILSDTLRFQSPTCTYTDRITAEKLAEIAVLNIEEFTTSMFKAGSSLQGKTPAEIFNQDMKEYKIDKLRVAVGQIYTMDIESLTEVKESLLEYMGVLSNRSNYDLVMLLVTDILNQGSELLFVGNSKELIAKAFNVDLEGNCIYLPGVVSRKKQVIPTISSVQD
jgi:Inorganic pyrophosphatase/exopolyphosphatase